jgi:hypothetical protein
LTTQKLFVTLSAWVADKLQKALLVWHCLETRDHIETRDQKPAPNDSGRLSPKVTMCRDMQQFQ